MNDTRRAYVACVAGRLISGKEVREVFDCVEFRRIAVFKNGNNGTPKKGDGGQSYTVISENGETQYLLFQPETDAPIDLTIVENNFKGYDYISKCFFGGSVRGDSISLFDYESSSYFNYSIKSH